ncbi:hypothetical protein N7494_005425 [Penicillium frequentans]|uniref:Uncharacterized protein n=1 Tax=Penicillium frequentans TaxID=3151616 RepID=A0AAD6CXX8_9EURO|nr:hypothetical protein N7494_005425 [Penicillium glabrum]
MSSDLETRYQRALATISGQKEPNIKDLARSFNLPYRTLLRRFHNLGVTDPLGTYRFGPRRANGSWEPFSYAHRLGEPLLASDVIGQDKPGIQKNLLREPKNQ